MKNKITDNLYLSTCSWNYPEWWDVGVYSGTYKRHYEYLPEYAEKFNAVEVDQWFWSLMDNGVIRLPKDSDVKNYNELTPNDFKFTIKAPNSITLTHFYKSEKPNKDFLSPDLLSAFLDIIKPLKEKIGAIMFEFEYLNKNKMVSLNEFIKKFDKFAESFPKDYIFAIETRNPNYLKKEYFEFLADRKIGFVLIEGYYMPPAIEVYDEFSEYIKLLPCLVFRLLGKDRQAIEEATGKIWNKIVEPRDETLAEIIRIILDFSKMKVPLYVNVNNHFEGSAPLTIKKIRNMILK
jgi:uncharacterized protein YecE (DUF72 family)